MASWKERSDSFCCTTIYTYSKEAQGICMWSDPQRSRPKQEAKPVRYLVEIPHRTTTTIFDSGFRLNRLKEGVPLRGVWGVGLWGQFKDWTLMRKFFRKVEMAVQFLALISKLYLCIITLSLYHGNSSSCIVLNLEAWGMKWTGSQHSCGQWNAKGMQKLEVPP